ncbi:MAG: hypothetical protein R2910_06090 [Gemmatimonadales bacterium]
MQTAQGPLAELSTRFTNYIPTLAAGLVVVLVGLVVGWLAKRAVIALLKWIRLDRLGGPTSWRSALAKADVRAALYNTVGTITMVVVLLVFLDNALQIWGLMVLASVADQMIAYLPNLAVAAVIIGVGLLIATSVGERVEDALAEAGLASPRLLGGIAKSAVLAIVAALAVWELNFARQIVMGAFLIGFGSIGVAFALAVGTGSSQAIREAWQQMFEKQRNQKKGD